MQKYLIAGLGNMGDPYTKTRHNIGFLVVERMAEKAGFAFKPSNFGEVCQFKYRGRPVTLLKPDTFMNLSGNAIDYWLKKENIKIENLMVVTDDLNLNFGTIRIRGKGSDGGHNGLKHIQHKLKTTKYPRLRFGIGDEFDNGRQIDYVLGQWGEHEKKTLNERLDKSSDAVFAFIFKGLNNAMNEFNGK
ncbi:aminoacyl-tRNA hydrolase [Flavobacteriaceae bacterium Ap0902]|nr:aminoacyl-tRNA hydrolase [Flavobacteriaceae bacterium Ap0902]